VRWCDQQHTGIGFRQHPKREKKGQGRNGGLATSKNTGKETFRTKQKPKKKTLHFRVIVNKTYLIKKKKTNRNCRKRSLVKTMPFSPSPGCGRGHREQNMLKRKRGRCPAVALDCPSEGGEKKPSKAPQVRKKKKSGRPSKNRR